MNFWKHKFVFLAFVLLSPILQGQEYSTVKIFADYSEIEILAELGLAVDHVHIGDGYVLGDFSSYEIALAREAGFTMDVIHLDAEVVSAQRASHTGARSNSACIADLDDFGIQSPNQFALGSYRGNFTYEEMEEQLDEMAARYPHLISVREPIGSYLTYEGRPIQWVRISDNPLVDEGEPEILYTALHHAREPVSLTQLIYFMWYVLENYEQDEKLRFLVQNTEMYFIPCVNPDGYIYNERQHPEGGGLWRKNRRPNPDGSFGVDLNRNYGYKWGLDNDGSSDNMRSETYRGTAPFSEPETQAVRDFVLEHDFKVALNYHSYGGYLIYPWGYTSQPAEDIEVFQELAILLTRQNRYNYGTGLETVNYHTNGDADDWMYGEQQEKPAIYAMTPEMGTEEHGFWPHRDDVEHLCKAALHQNLQAAYFLLSSGLVIDETEGYLTEKEGSTSLRITKLGFEDVGLSVSVKPITKNITFENTSRFYILSLFSKQRDQFNYRLSPDIQDGERVKFTYTVDNGTYQRIDTIVKYYQEPNFSIANDGTMADWQSQGLENNWSTTDRTYYSPPSSLTDSPNGNYVPYSSNYLTLKDPILISGTDSAVLTFKALWDIQHHFDYFRVEISTDGGGTYEALCGRHSSAAMIPTVAGEPIYTGRQLDWISERVDLSGYTGQLIHLRFAMVSTNNDTRDGIYIDDINVLQYDQGSITGTNLIEPEDFESVVVPNPISTMAQIVSDSDITDLDQILIYNQLGMQVTRFPFQKVVTLDVRDWPTGLYFYQVTDREGRRSIARKFIVGRS